MLFLTRTFGRLSHRVHSLLLVFAPTGVSFDRTNKLTVIQTAIFRSTRGSKVWSREKPKDDRGNRRARLERMSVRRRSGFGERYFGDHNFPRKYILHVGTLFTLFRKSCFFSGDYQTRRLSRLFGARDLRVVSRHRILVVNNFLHNHHNTTPTRVRRFSPQIIGQKITVRTVSKIGTHRMYNSEYLASSVSRLPFFLSKTTTVTAR